MLFYFIHSGLVLFKQTVCYGISLGVNVSMVQLNLYQFVHGYSTGGISRVRFRYRYVPKSYDSFRVTLSPSTKCAGLLLIVFSAMELHYTRARIRAMHVNPKYVVYKMAKNACEYCRHIKILKDHSMRSRLFL